MLKRHDVLGSGLKVDRDWWHATKLAIIVCSLAAAYIVNETLL